jgi:lipoprotein-anchoring transpeptidase ErfK/SrfK
MKILITALFTFALSASGAFAQDAGATLGRERPVDVAVNFTAKSLQLPWVKAVTGTEKQTIKVYEYGQLIIKDKVSTGRNAFEKKGEHKSKSDSWSVTPTGYYTPEYLDKDHKSGAYGGKWSWIVGGVKMPYAIFFNGGIALHQAPKGTEGQLGEKASGGCIRLPGDVASDLFARINETNGAQIPRFSVIGDPKLDNDGHQLYRTGFSALIVVQSQVID